MLFSSCVYALSRVQQSSLLSLYRPYLLPFVCSCFFSEGLGDEDSNLCGDQIFFLY